MKYLCFNLGQNIRVCSIMDIHGQYFLHCERGIHRIRRHDAQVRLLEADLIKAARHAVVEPRPFGRHNERPDISALGSHGGSDMFDITFCNPLSPARVRDGMENVLNLLKKAWGQKIRRFCRVLHGSATAMTLFLCRCQPWGAGILAHIDQ